MGPLAQGDDGDDGDDGGDGDDDDWTSAGRLSNTKLVNSCMHLQICHLKQIRHDKYETNTKQIYTIRSLGPSGPELQKAYNLAQALF